MTRGSSMWYQGGTGPASSRKTSTHRMPACMPVTGRTPRVCMGSGRGGTGLNIHSKNAWLVDTVREGESRKMGKVALTYIHCHE